MNLTKAFKQVQHVVSNNSPLILTAIGVTGTLTTAYLTGKASFKAAELLLEARIDASGYEAILSEKDLANREKFEMVWKLYIPAAGVASFTITSIIAANRIGTRRAATLAAAYAVTEKAYSEYKDKVVETIGKNKAQKVRDDIAQDHVRANPVDNQQVIITGGGDVLCFDIASGRYFDSSMETLKKAQNDTNYQILSNDYASLSDFYNRIGLANTKNSDNLGWGTDKGLELLFTTTMSDDDRPCIAVDFDPDPAPDYFRTH